MEQDMHSFQQCIECPVLCLQAERIMEAVELCREEQAKLAEHREKCAAACKEVGSWVATLASIPWVLLFLCHHLLIGFQISLQLPLPTPNPILVAFGNLTVSGLNRVCNIWKGTLARL